MIRWKAIAAVSLFSACTWAQAADSVPHWGYEGHGGADHWSELDKAFEVCKIGKTQSPIDIVTAQVESVAGAPIKPAYKSSPAKLANNGHTIVVHLADGGSVTVPSGTYKAVQFHFHAPSEEKIDGKSFPMVAHIVHSNDAGKLAVIAVLFNEGAENAALKEIFSALPAKEGEQPIKPFDTTALLPATLPYFAFEGSLTTPPCSEGVAWQVLKTPSTMSAAQIEAFRKIFPMNARPVQPLNGRKVTVTQ